MDRGGWMDGWTDHNPEDILKLTGLPISRRSCGIQRVRAFAPRASTFAFCGSKRFAIILLPPPIAQPDPNNYNHGYCLRRPSRSCHWRQPPQASEARQGQWLRHPRLQLHLVSCGFLQLRWGSHPKNMFFVFRPVTGQAFVVGFLMEKWTISWDFGIYNGSCTWT